MKFNQSDLYGYLKALKTVIPARSTIESIEGVLIRGKEMIANNLDLSMTIGIDNEDNECFIIPNSAIDFIGKLPNEEVEITFEDESIIIKTEKIKNIFRTYNTDQFIVPDKILKPKDHNVLDGEEFIKAVKKVIGTAAEVSLKPQLESVYITNKNGSFEIVTCDKYRIAIATVDQEMKEDKNIDVMIPLKSMKTIMKQTIANKTSIHDDGVKATFYFYEKTLTTRMLSGEYVDYKRLVSGMDHKGSLVTVDTKMFRQALARLIAARMSSAKRDPMMITVKDNNMTFKLTTERSEHKEVFGVDQDKGIEFEAAFNPVYLEEGVKHVEGKTFELQIIDRTAPILINDIDGSYKYLVTPVMTRG